MAQLNQTVEATKVKTQRENVRRSHDLHDIKYRNQVENESDTLFNLELCSVQWLQFNGCSSMLVYN